MMLDRLTALRAISKLQTLSTTLELNTLLPVEIKVAKKLDAGRYELLFGSKTVETKSFQELEVGAKYWGEVKKTPQGVVRIENLKQKPPFSQKSFAFKLTSDEVFSALTQGGAGGLKEQFLKQASLSEDKNEFRFFINAALLAEEEKIILPFTIAQKEYLLQLKEEKQNRQDDDIKQMSIQFYAAFPNMGPIEGKITALDEENVYAQITSMYPSTHASLLTHRKSLDVECQFVLKKNIEPLFGINEQLVDVVI